MDEINMLAAIIAAAATILAALIGIIITIRTNARGRRVSLFESIMRNMGSSSPEEIAEFRRELKRQFIVRDAEGNFQEIRKKSDIKKGYKGLKDIVLGLSANFNRACAVTVSALDEELTMSVIHLLGDAFMDYWAICYEILREEQNKRKDINNRMYFEFMAYLSFKILSKEKEKRIPETIGLYDGSNTSNPKIREDMLRRLELLRTLPPLKCFAKKMRKFLV
ncbi:hypothetical protein GX441_12300 [bacterium]|nr:hypothetical protein [bacterium]